MKDAVVSSSSITCRLCAEHKGAAPIQKVRYSVSKLRIRCPLQRGCDWKGILLQAEQHLDSCEFFLIECPLDCKAVLMRSEIQTHTEKFCLSREVLCEYCERKGAAGGLDAHLNECHKYPVSCPNECGAVMAREQIDEHNKTCPKKEIVCPFVNQEDSGLNCSEMLLHGEDIPGHNEEKHVMHLDMLYKKVLSLESKLHEMELKLKCKKDLDGCEWEIINLTFDKIFGGPEFYVNDYKLVILGYMTQDRILKFALERIEGDNDNNLGTAAITECRKVWIDRNNPSESIFESINLDYELEIGIRSDAFGATRIPKSENSPIFRFYFDIDNSQLEDIKSVYEKETDPMPDTF